MAGGCQGRIFGGSIPARQRYLLQMAAALKGSAFTDQKFPAPDVAVRSVSGSVKNHGDAAFQPVLRHHGSRMGVMMLYLKQRKSASGSRLLRHPGRLITRMQVADQLLRADAEQRFHPVQFFAEILIYTEIFHVSQILAQVGPLSRRQTKRRFQVAAEGQNLLMLLFCRKNRPAFPLMQINRGGHKAPASSEHLHMSRRNPHQGIIQRRNDAPCVPGSAVQRLGKTLPQLCQFLLLRENGIVRGICAGHHQRPRFFGEKLVQARIRKERPQISAFRAQGRTECVLPASFQKDDRSGGRNQQRFLLPGYPAEGPDAMGAVQRREHHRKGLFLPPL